MLIHKTGIVLSPKHYKDWHAECVGDPTDTGGIHVVLRHSDHQKPVTFWEVTMDEMEQVLRDQKITIIWEGENTISSFLDKCNLTKKLAKKSLIIFILKLKQRWFLILLNLSLTLIFRQSYFHIMLNKQAIQISFFLVSNQNVFCVII